MGIVSDASCFVKEWDIAEPTVQESPASVGAKRPIGDTRPAVLGCPSRPTSAAHSRRRSLGLAVGSIETQFFKGFIDLFQRFFAKVGDTQQVITFAG